VKTETAAESRQLDSNIQVRFGHQAIVTCREHQFVLLPERLHQIMNHPLIVNLVIDKETAVPGRLLLAKPEKAMVMYTRHLRAGVVESTVGTNVESRRKRKR
jgi:hypothetical protein